MYDREPVNLAVTQPWHLPPKKDRAPFPWFVRLAGSRDPLVAREVAIESAIVDVMPETYAHCISCGGLWRPRSPWAKSFHWEDCRG